MITQKMTLQNLSIQQLKVARTLLDLTQKEVAAAVGITHRNYNLIEIGKSDPKFSTIKKIVTFFENNGIIFLNDNGVKLTPSK